MRTESLLPAVKRRMLGVLALYVPGAESVRVWLHRRRGVAIGEQVFIGTDVMIETAHPQLVSVGSRVEIGARAMIVAHQQGEPVRPGDVSVRIDDDAYIGPGAMLLPHVTVGRGAVVHAGSIVTKSVAPLTMVRGNPAVAVARCGIPLRRDTPLTSFYRQLRPL
jgi:acetyltransferase-like isoleucine patch superfamily enzyme